MNLINYLGMVADCNSEILKQIVIVIPEEYFKTKQWKIEIYRLIGLPLIAAGSLMSLHSIKNNWLHPFWNHWGSLQSDSVTLNSAIY